MKFTFKKNPPTGLYRSFHLSYTDIKLKGRVVGTIAEQKDRSWKIRLMVKSDEHTCGWRWSQINHPFKEEADARTIVNSLKWQAAMFKPGYELHQVEN